MALRLEIYNNHLIAKKFIKDEVHDITLSSVRINAFLTFKTKIRV